MKRIALAALTVAACAPAPKAPPPPHPACDYFVVGTAIGMNSQEVYCLVRVGPPPAR